MPFDLRWVGFRLAPSRQRHQKSPNPHKLMPLVSTRGAFWSSGGPLRHQKSSNSQNLMPLVPTRGAFRLLCSGVFIRLHTGCEAEKTAGADWVLNEATAVFEARICMRSRKHKKIELHRRLFLMTGRGLRRLLRLQEAHFFCYLHDEGTLGQRQQLVLSHRL